MNDIDTDVIQTTETEIDGIKKKLRKVKRKCTVVRIAQAKGWRNVVVLDEKTKRKYFFGKVINPPPEINLGDELYIGYEDLPYELPGIKQKIILMTLDGFQLDWTMV
ncbi:hypothetical protein ANME2D_00053 [Candidatus Methanoperedens nitroreducens]|uniref:Uncharacterized protein n=1 Tax=Candidatus Methanoperedens nitratireducens TaxID=1392998 RepID=A0A062VBE1_9EURY|nr:hypothetical protein [Candidatus Methanoperedens nitroreducens]KCZ72994.1 hypothetical protein ANME2D_00053 [Candidatus Methanoperedens nitroreducens]MDJ1423062.1 hypothetical protein [Candidatus Methanoperedens sp.]